MRKSSSGKRVVRRQNVSRVVEESQHRPDRLCARVTIGILSDNVLLEIFDFHLNARYSRHHDAWHTLVHVCKRWRSIVFASPRRLQLQLLCTNKRPIHNTPDLWPGLPIVIKGRRGMSRPQVANNIIAALKQHNRVCDIDIRGVSNALLKKIRTMKMKDPFPVLTTLKLTHGTGNINALSLPDSFLGGSAPRLEEIYLDGVPFSAVPKLLLSAHHLVKLTLYNIPFSGYISPKAMVNGLSALTNLQNLDLRFRCPRSRADRENRLLPRRPRIVLPALTSFNFKSDSEYLEDIVGQIDTPLLHQADITLFNQLIFDTPLLCHLIGLTQTFKTTGRAILVGADNYVKVTLFGRDGSYKNTLSLQISCRSLDWQLSLLGQLVHPALSHFSTLECLDITNFREHSQDHAENTQWLEVLRPFTSVKDLTLYSGLIQLLAPVLEDLAEGRVTEVLPALQNLFLVSRQPSGPDKKAIGRFISARRLSDRPVTVHHRNNWSDPFVLLDGDR